MPTSAMQVDQRKTFSDLGSSLVKFFEWFGNLALFCGRVIRSALTPPYEIRQFVHQFDELGSKSLPLVALAGAGTGVVLTLSTRDSLIRFGAKSFLPAVVIFSIIKESGPIITALVVSGRAAAGIGAELGAMKVRASRRDGGFGRKPVQIFGSDSRLGLHVDASAADNINCVMPKLTRPCIWLSIVRGLTANPGSTPIVRDGLLDARSQCGGTH